jgi:3-isopropylmalate/(R)-2-methylmalate dehydratase small subunit
MEPLTIVQSPAVAFLRDNIDTDQLIPARFLQKPRRLGLQDYLLHDFRFAADGTLRPDCPLNEPRADASRILLTGRNFGGGSSREQAVYVLQDFGFRVVIAPGFGDIFRINALLNGLLPVQLPADAVASLATDSGPLAVDLEAQTVRAPSGLQYRFDIEPHSKHCLLHGLDEFSFTREYLPAIAAWEAAHQ